MRKEEPGGAAYNNTQGATSPGAGILVLPWLHDPRLFLTVSLGLEQACHGQSRHVGNKLTP